MQKAPFSPLTSPSIMKTKLLKLSILAVVSVYAAPPGLAAETNSVIKDWGGDFRYRIIQEDARKLNSDEPTNDRTWQRYRLRLWATLQVVPDSDINVRVITEPRYYNDRDDNQWVRDEILFDRLNVVVRDTFGLPLTTTVGRQGIRIADSWLVGEGTPLDGTRSDYFDAIRLVWAPDDSPTSIDFSYIENRRKSDAYIKPIHDQDFDVIEQDERGVVLYVGNELAEKRFLDTYFIYKKDHNPGIIGVTGETYTTGLRGHGNLTRTLAFNQTQACTSMVGMVLLQP